MLFAYTLYTAGVIVPVIAGFFRERLHVTATGAIAAMVGGGAAVIASKLLDVKYLDLWAILISIVVLFTISYIDNRMRYRK